MFFLFLSRNCALHIIIICFVFLLLVAHFLISQFPKGSGLTVQLKYPYRFDQWTYYNLHMYDQTKTLCYSLIDE